MRSNLGLFGVLSALALAWVGLVTAIPVDVSTMDSIPLEHLAPMEVVPITDVDEYLTSLLEEGSMAKRPPPKPQAQEEEDEPEYKCMQGFKCPIQGSHCCKGGQYCCVYGCNNDDETLTCRPNKFVNALRAAKQKEEEEADEEDKRKLWQLHVEQKTKAKMKELATKSKSEQTRKNIATKLEASQKKRRRHKEQTRKKSAANEGAHKTRMEEGKKREEATKKSSRALPLKARMVPYDRGYRHPKYARINGVCLVTGMAIGPEQNTRIARLPATCRPPERLVFDIHISRASTARYDVLPNGDITWSGGAYRSGGNMGHWVPFDGIAFVVRGMNQIGVPLNSPWVNYGRAGYQSARYRVDEDGFCVISGLIRTSDWRAASMVNPIFTMGPECTPKGGRLAFQVNHNEASFRLDILPNGEGHYVAGTKIHAWISLSGLIFYRESNERIQLHHPWMRYNKQYRAPSLVKKGSLCVLSGLAKADPWHYHIATLPVKCRPAKRLVFCVTAHDKSQRIDVLPNGHIIWVDGAKTWVSFDGIRFVVP